MIILSTHTDCGHCHYHPNLHKEMLNRHGQIPKGYLCTDLLVHTVRQGKVMVMLLHYCFAWWDEQEDAPSMADCIGHQNALYESNSEDRVIEAGMLRMLMPVGEPQVLPVTLAA